MLKLNPAPVRTPEDILQRRQLDDFVWGLISQLRHPRRREVATRVLLGDSYTEIAKDMGVTVSAIRQHFIAVTWKWRKYREQASHHVEIDPRFQERRFRLSAFH